MSGTFRGIRSIGRPRFLFGPLRVRDRHSLVWIVKPTRGHRLAESVKRRSASRDSEQHPALSANTTSRYSIASRGCESIERRAGEYAWVCDKSAVFERVDAIRVRLFCVETLLLPFPFAFPGDTWKRNAANSFRRRLC